MMTLKRQLGLLCYHIFSSITCSCDLSALNNRILHLFKLKSPANSNKKSALVFRNVFVSVGQVPFHRVEGLRRKSWVVALPAVI